MQPMILFPGKCIRWITAQVFKQFLDLLNTLYFLIFNNTSSLYSLMDIVSLKSSDNYIPEKRFREYYVFVSNAVTAAASQSWHMHYSFKYLGLVSSIIDTVVPFKMAAGGHVVKNLKKSSVSIWNGQKSDFRTSKMAAGRHFVKNAIASEFRTSKMAAEKKEVPYRSEMRLKVNFGHPKWPIDLKCPEMRLKVIFGHSTPTAAILSKKITKKTRNSISIWNGQKCDRNDFRPPVAILWNKLRKIKIVVSIWNSKKCEQKWFLDIQNGCQRPFFKKHLQKSCESDLNNVRTDCWPTTTWYKFTFDQYIYIQTGMLEMREYTLCSPFRANAHNSSFVLFTSTRRSSHTAFLVMRVSLVHRRQDGTCTSEDVKCLSWVSPTPSMKGSKNPLLYINQRQSRIPELSASTPVAGCSVWYHTTRHIWTFATWK